MYFLPSNIHVLIRININIGPIDGHWNKWSSWSECAGECEHGKRHRTRTCDDPEPKNGGKACVGSNKDESQCSLPCGFGKVLVCV